MEMTELLKSKIEPAYARTEKLMQRVKDEGLPLDWKPSTENNWMTTGQLLRHLASACGGPTRGFVTGEWGVPVEDMPKDLKLEDMLPKAETFEDYSTVDEALDHLRRDKADALKLIDEAGEDRLINDPAPAMWDPTPVKLGMRLLEMIEHQDSHRLQLYYYLKLQGVPVNTMNLWGTA